MIARKHLLALAIAALVAGCGGGDTRESAALPSLSNKALHAPAGALAAVSPQEAARQLMDYAEGRFPGIFPGHPATGSLGPFSFRAYPGGIYLGVVVAEGTPFTFEGVYVVGILGGTLANPAYVGQLRTFITPLDPGTGGGGAHNGCFDLVLADTQNTRIIQTFEYSGAITGSQTIDSLVGGVAMFEGHQARETAIRTTGTNTVGSDTVTIDMTGTSYSRRTGDTEMTHYGSVVAASFAGFDSTTRLVYSPPSVDRQASLAIGASLTTTQIGTANTKIPALSLDQTTAINSSTTTKYVGQEAVTVPAGTYSTCKFEQTTAGSAEVTTNWVIVSKGIPVQISTNGAQAVTLKATVITLNGQPL